MKFQSILTAGKWCSYTGKQDWFLVFHDKQFKNGHDNCNNQQKKPQNAKSSHKFKPTCNKSISDYISWSWKISTSTLKQTCLYGLNETYYFKVDLRLQGNLFFFVSPLASLYIMMIFLFIICDWIDSFSVILYAL